MDELLSAHFIQEAHFYVQTLADYRARELIMIAHPFILASAGFVLGYLVRHLQSRIKRTYRYKRRRSF
jgi:hypothetical protein